MRFAIERQRSSTARLKTGYHEGGVSCIEYCTDIVQEVVKLLSGGCPTLLLYGDHFVSMRYLGILSSYLILLYL